jgi:enolase
MLTSAQLHLHAAQIADSRGRPTVRVTASAGGHTGVGDVPAGASKGEDEARTVPIGQALTTVHEVLLPLLRQAQAPLGDAEGIAALDRAMVAQAGDNFAALGANATLPTSRALWQLGAQIQGVPLHAFLAQSKLAPKASSHGPVSFYMNIFNGGLHALKADEVLGRDRIAIQEIMVVPVGAASYAQALAMGDAIDGALKKILINTYGAEAVSRADEAGFSVKGLGDDSRAISHVVAAIEAAGMKPGTEVKLALDVAASSFFDRAHKTYAFGGRDQSSADMVAWHTALVGRYPNLLLSIEDGLDENDWTGWRAHSQAMAAHGVLTIGDDLFVTQLPRLRRGIGEKSAHAVLIKVNQNGTVTTTLDVIGEAHAAGMRCVVSHRSGETLDDSIADLAVAIGAMGLKSGDPQPPADFADEATWVRRRKYLRMVEIEAATDPARGA